MKKVKFIYNPISGSASNPKLLDTVIHIYQQHGRCIIPFRIGEEIELEEAFRDIDESYEHILISGGDGTVNRAINIYEQKGLQLPIALLPTGTANDFAKYLNMPLDIKEACEKILSSEIRHVDLGLVNGKYFINVFSFGLFTEVSQKTPTHLKNTFGKLAYYFSGIKELPSFQKMDLQIVTEDLQVQAQCFLAFVFNGQTAGNLSIAYESKIDDGLLDVILVKGDNFFQLGNLAYSFLKGEHLEENQQQNILYFKAKDIRFSSSQNLGTDIDGEMGPELPVEISCLPKKLAILY